MCKIRKFCCALLAALMLVPQCGMAKEASLLAFDGGSALAPYINEQGVAMLPVRYFLRSLHIPVEFDAKTGTVSLSTDNIEVELSGGSKTVAVNGTAREISTPPENRGGYMFVPARDICGLLGYEVEWYPEMRCINIVKSDTAVSAEVSFERADAAAKSGAKEIGDIAYEPIETADYIGEREKHVLAFIMGNERTAAYTGAYRCWSNAGRDGAHKPDNVYPDGKRDIAGVYYPSVGLYDALDPDYMEYRAQLFKMCYIDTASFYTVPNDDLKGAITSVLVPTFKKYGLTACLRLSSSTYSALGLDEAAWKKMFFDDIEEYISLFGDINLRVDKRPVVTVFNSAGISADDVREWKKKFAAEDTPFVMRWLVNTFNADQAGAYDGMYDWVSVSSNRNGYLFPNTVAPYKAYSTAQFAKYHHILDLKRANDILDSGTCDYYAMSVSPGFDDTAVWGWGSSPSVNERGENGDVYEFKWKYAADSSYPMITIPTWDDWGEGSGIEPTLEYGNEYLELTREYAAKYFGVEPNDANLNLPDWIYKIRKTSDDSGVLADMKRACGLIAQEKYAEAEKIVKPYAEDMGICDVYTLFNYPTTQTTLVDYPAEPEPPKDGTKAVQNTDGSVMYYPVADAYVRDGAARSSNFASSTELTVKNATSGFNRKIYLRFDTSDKIKNFSKATLRLYVSSLGRDERNLMIYETDNSWTEDGIVWQNAPDVGEVWARLDTPVSMAKKWVTADITELVKKYYGKEFSIVIENVGASSEENQLNFGSRELNGKEPQLILE